MFLRQLCGFLTFQRIFRRRFLRNKLNDAEADAAETQVWLEYSVKCEYLGGEIGKELHQTYDNVIGKLVNMANTPEPWLLKVRR